MFQDNDIAIIFLKTPVSGVKFAKLPNAKDTFDSSDAETMGWGAIATKQGIAILN